MQPNNHKRDERKDNTVTERARCETTLRATVAALPYIGGAIGEIVFGHRDRTKQQRLADFLGELAHRLGDIEESMVDTGYLESEDFADLLEAVLERSVRVRTADNRARLAQALCEQITNPIPIDFALFA